MQQPRVRLSSLKGNTRYKTELSAAALEIAACASTGGLSVTGETPSLQAHTEVEGLTCLSNTTVVRSNNQRLLARALQSLGRQRYASV